MENGDTFCTDCMSEICKIFDLYLDSAEYFKHPSDQAPIQDFKPEIKEEHLSAAEEKNLRSIYEIDLKQFNEHCECPEPEKTEFTLQELAVEIEKAVTEAQLAMEEKCASRINQELEGLSEKFDLVLSNEQARNALRFHEAERQYSEKIGALRNHLECKNMTALMYVLANERRTAKLKTTKLIKGFNDREADLLEDIVNRDQLLNAMMKEHRLATMVNAEWHDKMTKLLCAFHKFIAYAFDRTPDSVQYFLDVPALMGCESLKESGKEEETIETVPEETVPVECERLTKICSKCNAECGCKQLAESPSGTWWKMLAEGGKPFIVYGDLSDMPPPLRRQVLRTLPDHDGAELDTYVFNDRVLKADCDNVDVAQEYYNAHPKEPCQLELVSICSYSEISCVQEPSGNGSSQPRLHSDVTSIASEPPAPGILAAKDSMEIVSSTRLLTKGRKKKKSILLNKGQCIKLEVKKSAAKEEKIKQIKMPSPCMDPCGHYYSSSESSSSVGSMTNIKNSKLGKIHNDSISLLAEANPELVRDKIEDIVTCPRDACIRHRMGPYLSKLPPYMWPTKPNYNEDISFKDYKPCTQSQIDKLLEQQAAHHHLQLEHGDVEEGEVEDVTWTGSCLLKEGSFRKSASVAISESGGITTCECDLDRRGSVQVKIYGEVSGKKNKDMLDEIPEAKLWNTDVEMKRMHVLGSEDRNLKLAMGKEEFLAKRVSSIKKILADYPSMCSLFHGASKCV